MRSAFIVVATLLVAPVARPALASALEQSNAWSFPSAASGPKTDAGAGQTQASASHAPAQAAGHAQAPKSEPKDAAKAAPAAKDAKGQGHEAPAPKDPKDKAAASSWAFAGSASRPSAPAKAHQSAEPAASGHAVAAAGHSNPAAAAHQAPAGPRVASTAATTRRIVVWDAPAVDAHGVASIAPRARAVVWGESSPAPYDVSAATPRANTVLLSNPGESAPAVAPKAPFIWSTPATSAVPTTASSPILDALAVTPPPAVAPPPAPKAPTTPAAHQPPSAPASPKAAPVTPKDPPSTQTPKPAGPSIDTPKPQPTGLERLSDEWPDFVKVGVQYRGRAEAQRGTVATNGRDDEYYLSRVRLEATLNMMPWLKAYAQVQDSQTLGYDLAAQPTSLTNTFDMRQGYLDARWTSAQTIGLRLGRQELAFGEQRLVGASDWGNTARAFDGVRVSVGRPGVQVDAFAASLVVVNQHAFDTRRRGETFSGAYVSLSRIVPNGAIEPYVFAKLQDTVTGELGGTGTGARYTVGARAVGKLPHHLDYSADVAVQRGRVATDQIGAWAGHYRLGWTVRAPMKPRVIAEFNHASGDADPADGRRGTFDQLFPTNHSKYGIADQIGWRNVRDLMVGVELAPTKKLKLNVDAHWLALATVADAFYAENGTLKVINRVATSRTVGTEVDVQGMYSFSKELSFGAGIGALFSGGYLTQSTAPGTVWTPYFVWNVKF
jgi:Alginate export